MADLVIRKKNEVFLRVECDPHIKHELQDQFTFDVPGAKFMPQYRNKYWDGKIRLFNMDKGEIYCGLIDKLQVFLSRDIHIHLNLKRINIMDYLTKRMNHSQKKASETI